MHSDETKVDRSGHAHIKPKHQHTNNVKLQALVYDILPSTKVPESDDRSVQQCIAGTSSCLALQVKHTVKLPAAFQTVNNIFY